MKKMIYLGLISISIFMSSLVHAKQDCVAGRPGIQLGCCYTGRSVGV